MLTIKKAAELTGVPEHTLRAWERRYDGISTRRTAAGYRVYDETTLAHIETMRDLVQSGLAPREAAAQVARSARPAEAARSQDRLLRAAVELDAAAVTQVLEEQFSQAAFETVVDEWLMPALVRLGRAWAEGQVTVAAEHLVSSAVMRFLAAVYNAADEVSDGPAVVIGAAPRVDHELGLLAFASAARRAGLNTVYLGAKVPADSWRIAVEKVDARSVVSSLHRSKDAARLGLVADALADVPNLELWVGGRHQHNAPKPFRPLGHSIAEAAADLAGRLDAGSSRLAG